VHVGATAPALALGPAESVFARHEGAPSAFFARAARVVPKRRCKACAGGILGARGIPRASADLTVRLAIVSWQTDRISAVEAGPVVTVWQLWTLVCRGRLLGLVGGGLGHGPARAGATTSHEWGEDGEDGEGRGLHGRAIARPGGGKTAGAAQRRGRAGTCGSLGQNLPRIGP
jgi:hypothetical protein